MDIIIAIALVIVGFVIGFFTSQFLSRQQNEQSTARKNAEKNIKAVMTQQAEHHVFQTKQVVENLESQLSVLKDQLEDYESHLHPQEEENDKPNLSFFGEQTTAMLRNAYKAKKSKSDSTGEQPRDFSGKGSGLFVDNKTHSTERN